MAKPQVTRAPRDDLVARLHRDLIGPDSENEVLEARPSDVYLTGILWPREARMGAEEDVRLSVSGSGGRDDTDEGGAEEEIRLSGLRRPSVAGISFAARTDGDKPGLSIRVSFATYEPGEKEMKSASEKSPAIRRSVWTRHPVKIQLPEVSLPRNSSMEIDLANEGAPQGVKLHIRAVDWSHGVLATITLVNDAVPESVEGRQGVERLTLFQVRLEIYPDRHTKLVGRPSRRPEFDDDDRTAGLLYRNALEFAVGHTCSADWEASEPPTVASMVATSWIPSAVVPAINPDGNPVFNSFKAGDRKEILSAGWLWQASSHQLGAILAEVPSLYGVWLDRQDAKASELPKAFQETARKNIAECRKILRRMADGAKAISTDPIKADAFRLANLAMHIQHGWDPEKRSIGPLIWRPFQLGFVLLAAESTVSRAHADRSVMDLLWFPTGGGKTEAYLALIAFVAFHRRLVHRTKPDDGAGVAAIMRYTLRLLTTQQFSRASAMIMACEGIRRGTIKSHVDPKRLGTRPFSIGLWVGGEATPNNFKQAAAALAGSPDEASPKQLLECPACRGPIEWFADEDREAVDARCANKECLLFDSTAPLPLYTVDTDLYRAKPTLLIGTIDKFAQIVRRKEINALFSLGSERTPDLIIQDELHLISGPLGTLASLYEAALDRMFSSGDVRPKIIGSTATIRRAPDQVKALFDRAVCQFPPACIDASDSGFAVVDTSAPGRLYAGITTAGRSAKFTLQAVAASLSQSALGAFPDDKTRDPYWTLVTYFNSLRELGGALVLMQDDVNDSLTIVAARRGEQQRRPGLIEELTSRRTQAEVRDMLAQLNIRAGDPRSLDVVLATNMLSVGVDIPRLGLMLVNGQPKGIAEYIQATSRVGRGRVPGLVVGVLNNAKARDRSHYETFASWHSTLYRDVEATSVTPFASRARDRALHAVLVALVRHLVPGMLDKPDLDDAAVQEANKLITEIAQRAKDIDPEETAVRKELMRRLQTWEDRSPAAYWNSFQPNRSLLQDAERAATLKAMGRSPGEAWPTMNNMRNVEPDTRFRLAERLRVQQARRGETNGGQ